MIKKMMAGVLLASLALTTAAPAVSADAEGKGKIKSSKNAVERVVGYSANNNDRLGTLIAAVTCDYFDGAVVDLLATTDKITIFAPTNYAFRKLGRTLGVPGGLTPANVCTVDSLLGKGTLLNVLSYHVFGDGKVWYKQAKAARGASIPMLNGGLAEIGGKGSHVTWAGGNVKVKNIRSANAIIHVVDEVGLPPLLVS